jgi:hypothetical protein
VEQEHSFQKDTFHCHFQLSCVWLTVLYTFGSYALALADSNHIDTQSDYQNISPRNFIVIKDVKTNVKIFMVAIHLFLYRFK